MSKFTSDLMKQLRYISLASNEFMHRKKQRFTGQQRVLAVLAKEDGLIQSQLAEILDIRPSSLAELLKKMETAGDIIRKEDAQDKRLKRVFVTDQGKEKVAENADTKEDLSEAFFAGLTDEEKTIFSDYLAKIASGWDKKFQQESARFVDPMDRLQQMQDFRQQMFDSDWQNLSREEKRAFKAKWRENMQGMHAFGGPFGGAHRPNHGHGHDCPRGSRQDFRDFPGGFDSRKDFFGKHPFGPQDAQNGPSDKDEWQDF